MDSLYTPVQNPDKQTGNSIQAPAVFSQSGETYPEEATLNPRVVRTAAAMLLGIILTVLWGLSHL